MESREELERFLVARYPGISETEIRTVVKLELEGKDEKLWETYGRLESEYRQGDPSDVGWLSDEIFLLTLGMERKEAVDEGRRLRDAYRQVNPRISRRSVAR